LHAQVRDKKPVNAEWFFPLFDSYLVSIDGGFAAIGIAKRVLVTFGSA